MNMDKGDFLKLVQKYNAGVASPEEIQFLHAYYELSETAGIDPQLESASAKETLRVSMRDAMKPAIDARIAHKNQAWYLQPIAIAASVTMILFATFLAVSPVKQKKQVLAKDAPVQIVPGGSKATLTLADGSTIILEGAKNGVLAMQGNTAIRKTSNGQIIYVDDNQRESSKVNGSAPMNMISTPRGGQYQLTLPDGSRVWLNSASSIRFPAEFDGNARVVEITGEAYFEVAKVFKVTSKVATQERLPFIVRTADQEVEVLGTHFNVNAYTDESETRTTLLEGKVKVSGGSKQLAKILAPGQQSLVLKNKADIDVEEADLESAVAWKNGYFKFNKQDLKTIMRQISRWYDVDVTYAGAVSSDLFVGKIKRSENIADVLRVLEISKVNFRFSGKKIIVK